MYLYHATKMSNLLGIMDEGLKPGIDGLIYFTTEHHHSVNWIDMGNIDGEDILCVRVSTAMLDSKKIDDGYDHSPTFFKGITVKTYADTIPFEDLDQRFIRQYQSRYYEPTK